MEKTLVIINECFPFDKGEPFLETESNYYNKFSRVLIIPCSAQGDFQTRKIKQKNISIVKFKEKKGIALKLIKVLRYAKALFHPIVFQELKRLKAIGKISIATIRSLLYFVSEGEYHFKRIDQWLKDNGVNGSEEILFYSYWMYFHSYTAIKLKSLYPNSKAVSRCHRFDLYESRNERDYIPLRPYILDSLDMIFSISQDGKRYLEKKYSDTAKNLQISRLGSRDQGIKNVDLSRRPLKIVSCSFVSAVKRVERIVDVLTKLENIEVHWVHFGDGDDFEKLKANAKQGLSDNIAYEMKGDRSNDNLKANTQQNRRHNITYELMGAISNKQLLETYKTHDFHVFVNVSETEGIPVSIMEAMSFGIPVIATDVGGIKEIVEDGYNGYLMKKDFMDEDLTTNFMKIYNMSELEYSQLRKNAREFWEKNYNADSNYRKFTEELLALS